MEEAWTKLKRNCCLGKAFESAVFESKEAAGMDESVIHEYMQEVIDVCREKRKRKKEGLEEENLSDERLSRVARFTDKMPLSSYANVLHLVPRLVNVVTVCSLPLFLLKDELVTLLSPSCACQLAEAIPVAGTGLTLPLNLHTIAAKCKNSYYAPKRFAAVKSALNTGVSRLAMNFCL